MPDEKRHGACLIVVGAAYVLQGLAMIFSLGFWDPRIALRVQRWYLDKE